MHDPGSLSKPMRALRGAQAPVLLSCARRGHVGTQYTPGEALDSDRTFLEGISKASDSAHTHESRLSGLTCGYWPRRSILLPLLIFELDGSPGFCFYRALGRTVVGVGRV